MIDDKGFIILIDGTPAYFSYSYNSKEATDISFVNPELVPSCRRNVLENVGSDRFPVLMEQNRRQSTYFNSDKRWCDDSRA
ncbi:uncharacterized protein NPIL_338871 [Nephila pilipes]|uniref:Uncharacterized protein n=1 Tax=Nephila pilipes TaxID=299642 RepID=A0A8X6T6X1_NEPPI|nr:uncharacterized protein NPIL_338871 [Nephila pilipes]